MNTRLKNSIIAGTIIVGVTTTFTGVFVYNNWQSITQHYFSQCDNYQGVDLCGFSVFYNASSTPYKYVADSINIISTKFQKIKSLASCSFIDINSLDSYFSYTKYFCYDTTNTAAQTKFEKYASPICKAIVNADQWHISYMSPTTSSTSSCVQLEYNNLDAARKSSNLPVFPNDFKDFYLKKFVNLAKSFTGDHIQSNQGSLDNFKKDILAYPTYNFSPLASELSPHTFGYVDKPSPSKEIIICPLSFLVDQTKYKNELARTILHEFGHLFGATQDMNSIGYDKKICMQKAQNCIGKYSDNWEDSTCYENFFFDLL